MWLLLVMLVGGRFICSVAIIVVVVVVVVVPTLTRIIKSAVTGQAPVTLELRNTIGKNANNPRWYTYMSQLTQFVPPPGTYKSEIGSQSTMFQVYTNKQSSLCTYVGLSPQTETLALK